VAGIGQGSRGATIRDDAVVTAPGRGEGPLGIGDAVLGLAQVRQAPRGAGAASRPPAQGDLASRRRGAR
jgi:hypothetical protein